MKVTKKEGMRLFPRDSIEYFKKNPNEWRKLDNGKPIEITEELFKQISHTVIVEKPKKEVVEEGEMPDTSILKDKDSKTGLNISAKPKEKKKGKKGAK